jgi:transcriptional regulator with XRE-family HTH domain
MPSPELPHSAQYVKLGLALRELRHTAALTQVQAADQAGIGSNFISAVERGERGMRWHTLLALLSAYGADLHDLADALKRA